jgi:2-dehydropantoate 2-reductase
MSLSSQFYQNSCKRYAPVWSLQSWRMSLARPRILIFGTGNIGAVYASILASGGTEISCICRSNFTEVQNGGIQVKSSILGDRICKPKVARTVDEILSASTQPFDYIVVSTKAVAAIVETTVEMIQPAITPGITAVVLIQNGLGIEEPYHVAFPCATIISGVAYIPTTQVAPGVFSHSEIERLHLGLYGTDRNQIAWEQLNRFASLVKCGGGTAIVEEDIQVERWRKIVANGAVNPICALSRCRDGYLMKVAPAAIDLFRKVMLEIAAVAHASGYGEVVNADTVEYQLQRTLLRPYPGVQPSMMADVLARKQLEVEAILGHLVKIACEKSVNVPHLDTLLVLLQGLDAVLQLDVTNSR